MESQKGSALGSLVTTRPRPYHRRFLTDNGPDTVSETISDSFQSDRCATLLKALAEPLRLRIVDLLRQGELTVSDIAEFLGVEVVLASHHLQVLKHAELVAPHREGRFIYYQLREDMLQSAKGKSTQFLDLGCCRIEVPCSPAAPESSP